MTYNEIEKVIQTIRDMAEGTFFSVWFTKKDGSDRKMVCRLGVAKNLKGGSLGYNPVEKKLLHVFDVQKDGYRMIKIENIYRVKIKGEIVFDIKALAK